MTRFVSTRREFLHQGLALIAAGVTVPAFLEQTAHALGQTRPADADRVLVVVQLAGGNDGLNTLIPYADDAYYRARPALAVEANAVLKLNDHVGLHPEMAGLRKLFDDGLLCVVQGVGYPNPNRSHFRSMDIWHSAQPDKELPTSGWLGRYFDAACAGADPHVAVSIGGSLPLAMQGVKVTPLAFERPESYRYAGRDADAYRKLNRIDAPKKPTTKPGAKETTLDFLHRTALDAQLSSDEILRIARAHRPAGNYPGGELGNALRTVAAMIGGNLGTRVYYVSLGGFDTHANQRGRHEQLLRQFSDAVAAFWADVRQQKNEARVLMMTFSEFGRRVGQNASGGTDHGAAAPMFLLGPKVKHGVVGKHPSLTDLDQGDLKHTVDFREIYAAVLENWLGAPAAPILGGRAKPLEILARR